MDAKSSDQRRCPCEALADEVLFEDFKQRLPCESPQRGNLPDYPCSSIALDCFLVLRAWRPDQHHSLDRYSTVFETTQRQKRVVNCSQSTARRQDHRKSQMPHKIRHELGVVDGHHHTSCPFRNECHGFVSLGRRDFPQRDFLSSSPCCQVGRQRIIKHISLRHRMVGWHPCPGNDRLTIRSFVRAGLDRFPIHPAQGCTK